MFGAQRSPPGRGLPGSRRHVGVPPAFGRRPVRPEMRCPDEPPVLRRTKAGDWPGPDGLLRLLGTTRGWQTRRTPAPADHRRLGRGSRPRLARRWCGDAPSASPSSPTAVTFRQGAPADPRQSRRQPRAVALARPALLDDEQPGFRHELDWIRPAIADADGRPRHERGVACVPGLHFVGLPFQTGLTSAILAGVGRDAERIVGRVRAQLAAPVHQARPPPPCDAAASCGRRLESGLSRSEEPDAATRDHDARNRSDR